MRKLVLNRPILCIFTMCLLSYLTAGIFFGNKILNTFGIHSIILMLAMVFFAKNPTDKVWIFSILLLEILTISLFKLSDFLLLISLFVFVFIFIKKNIKSKKLVTLGNVTLSYLLHLYFIDEIKFDKFQHDLIGILTYMYLFEEGISNFAPWYTTHLFHQPLHFAILQGFCKLTIYLWNSILLSNESLQYVPLFYVTGTTLFITKILRLFKFSNIVFYSTTILAVFNPTLTLFSNYLSNDTPMLFWGTVMIYFILLWYKTNRIKYIKLGAICFGLGTLSKLSILITVPAISFLFLLKLFDKKNIEKTIRAIALFIIIAVPLSLLWVFRNHILFDMQFYNVPNTSPNEQNFFFLSLYDRLTDLSLLKEPFIDSPRISDANIVLSIIKTELFGEWDFRHLNKHIYTPSLVLYIMNIVIWIIGLLGTIYMIFKYRNKLNPLLAFFIILYLTSLLYMLKFAMDYPYVCSTDYRLIPLLIISHVVILGSLIDNLKKVKFLFCGIAFLYAILSIGIYLTITI